MASDKVLALSNDNFKQEVLDSAVPVLVDFWAPWCSPCRMIAPVVDEIAGEYDGKAKVGKLNVDDNRQIAVDFGVMSIPTLIVFKGGKAVDRVIGFKSKGDLKGLIDKNL